MADVCLSVIDRICLFTCWFEDLGGACRLENIVHGVALMSPEFYLNGKRHQLSQVFVQMLKKESYSPWAPIDRKSIFDPPGENTQRFRTPCTSCAFC